MDSEEIINEPLEVDGYCHDECREFSFEELGDDAWNTGCPLCGCNCWEYEEEETE